MVRITMLLIVALALPALPALAQTTQPTTGINLEGVLYPYPVQRFKLTAQNEQLEMAYMDVRPDDANGQTVVLLHGKNFNGDYWGRTARDLAAAGYRVVIPDQIGFGKSSKPMDFNWSFQQLASNTAALLDDLGVDHAVILGHSMGGMLATRFTLMYPDRTDALVLVNPIGLEDWKTMVPYTSVDKNYQSELGKTRDGIKQYMLKSYYDGQWKPEYDRPLDLLAGMLESPDWPRMAWVQAATSDMVFTQPVVYEFDQIKAATLLIIGTRDRTAIGASDVSPDVRETLGRYDVLGRQTADKIDNAKLVELDNVGHLPHLEAYERFIEPLKTFLAAQKPREVQP